MPLGKLKKSMILAALEALTALESSINQSGADQKTVEEYTNRFYTLIPHACNRATKLPMLDTVEKVGLSDLHRS
jgi:hypothetical protein